jgi:hypothetical protein
VCDSADLMREYGARKTVAAALLAFVPIWFWRSRLRCTSCGGSWLVPLTFRPNLALAWLICSIGVILFTLLVALMVGFAIEGRT